MQRPAILALLLVQHAQSELTPIKIGLEWFLNPDHLQLCAGNLKDALRLCFENLQPEVQYNK